jgi:DNA-binding transcriptional MerR regulator
MKKLPKDWRVLNDLFGFMEPQDDAEPKEIAGYHLIVAKINDKCLTASDVKRILNLSYRRIHEWDKRQVRLADRFSDKDGSWRRFSIEDIFSFAILLALKHLKIPISRNKKIAETIRSSPIVESILIPITEGKKTFLYHDAEDIAGFYIEGHGQKLLDDILKAQKPLIIIPLRDIFIWVLKRSVRDDFRVEYDKEKRKLTFYLNNEPIVPDKKYQIIKEKGGEEIVFKMLEINDQKDDNQNKKPAKPKPADETKNINNGGGDGPNK